jgi:hypothetical protein
MVCLLSILTAAIKKRSFQMFLGIMWLLFVCITFVLTWIHYQNFDASEYSKFIPEWAYLIDGVGKNIMLAKIVLGMNVSIAFVAIIYIVILIASIINGVKKTARNTKTYVSDKYTNTKNNIKDFFSKDQEHKHIEDANKDNLE